MILISRPTRSLALAAIVGLSGCGSPPGPSTSTPTTQTATHADAAACPADVGQQVSRLGGGRVAVQRFVAPDGAAACRLEVRGGPVVTITLDTAPQAYARLEREIVETGQVFGPRRMTPAPVHVGGLGLDASWFPGLQRVLTANSRALVSVGVLWSGQPVSRRKAAAVSVARTVIAGS
ncbi:MAG TPA: hypothetical protein VG165_06950 [Solirubrobacteraceae bacterium]|nr:hypothetical protein [Solirubrobacteraceae bacterium]